MLLNIGLGLGGLISATIIDVNDPTTFEWLYGLTALSFLALFVAVLAMGNVGGLPDDDPESETGTSQATALTRRSRTKEGWAEVVGTATSGAMGQSRCFCSRSGTAASNPAWDCSS